MNIGQRQNKGRFMKFSQVTIYTAFFLAVEMIPGGCGYELDTQRHPAQRGTFGQEIYRILKKDLDRRSPPEGTALGRQKDVFIRSIDGIVPESLLQSMQQFCIEILPLYDQKMVQYTVRPLACMLDNDLASDEGFLQAIWYVRRPEGYGHDSVLMPLLKKVGIMEITPVLLVDMLGLFLEHDGLDANFTPSDEDDIFAELLINASIWLAERSIEQTKTDSSWTHLRNWLFRQDPRLDSGFAGTEPVWMVLVDQRGRAMLAQNPDTGKLPEPFVDMDHDGLADVDPDTGDYLDKNDFPIEAPMPFSTDGQRPMNAQHLLYRYSDLRYTPMAALVSQLEPMVSQGLLWELPKVLTAVVGVRTQKTDDSGTFEGYDPDSSSFLAMVHALVAILDYPRLPQLLQSILTIAEMKEPQLASLLAAGKAASDILDQHQNTALMNHNRLLDDLVPHLLSMSRRAYLLRTMESFNDPRWRSLGPGLAEMIKYRSVAPDAWDYYDEYDTYEQYLQVRRAMDWTRSDEQYQYRSNLQRSIHLIADTNAIAHSTEIFSIHVPFEIEDMLAFFLDSTARLAEVPGWAEPFLLEFSSTNPTTEEVNRFMVNNHTMLGNPVGRQGQEAKAQGDSNWEQYELRRFNAESLMALEFSGALEGLRPMFSTIVQLDRGESPSGTRVLADFLAALHPHYSCNLPYASAACANLRVMEPILLDILEHTQIMNAVVDFMSSIQNLQTSNGYWVLAELDQFVNHLLEPDAALRRFDGSSSVMGADDVTKVEPISPFYLLLDAMRLMDDALSADAEADGALSRSADILWDQFLQVEQDQGTWRFSNNQAWTLLLDLLDYLRARSKQHVDVGDLSEQLHDINRAVYDAIDDRLTPGLIDAWRLLAVHPRLPGELDQVVLALLDQSKRENVAQIWRLVAWSIQHLQVDKVTVPIGRALGKKLDPHAQGWMFAPGTGCSPIPEEYEPLVQLRWISKSVELIRQLLLIRVEGGTSQVRDVLSRLLRNAFTMYSEEVSFPADDILGVLAAVHRRDPLSQDELDTGDIAHIFSQISEFILDEQHGIEKLYEMIDFRDDEK